MSEGESDLAVQSLAAIGDTSVAKAMNIRKAAAVAFHEVDCQQAVRAAATHGPRPHYSHETGQAVYFWRRATDTARKPATYFWHGPAKIVGPPIAIYSLVVIQPASCQSSSREGVLFPVWMA